MLLAHGLARGELGPLDLAGAERWFARAAAGGDLEALDAHAYFLYYILGSTDGRARALALWRKVPADTADADFVWNNLSWALCTGPDASLRSPEEGLVVVRRMGEVALLPLGVRDTVAACQAAAGRHADAALLQRSVIERVQSNNAADPSLPRMRERLALYEAGKAYIEEQAQ
jgi:TPR repeat protein